MFCGGKLRHLLERSIGGRVGGHGLFAKAPGDPLGDERVTGTQITRPARPKRLPATVMAVSTQKPERPVLPLMIRGAMMLPSTCCKTMIKMMK